MERIFVSRDEIEVPKALARLRQWVDDLNELTTEFNALNVGSITPELVVDALRNNSKAIEELVLKQVSANLKSLKNEGIKQTLRQAGMSVFSQFKENVKLIVSRCREYNVPTHLKYCALTVNGWESTTEDEKRYISACCDYFIDDPQEIEIYNAHKAAAEVLSNLYKLLNFDAQREWPNLFGANGDMLGMADVLYTSIKK